MANTDWTKHFSDSTVIVFNKAGFYTNEDFDDVPVMGLFLLEGIDTEDVDDLLKALYFEENTWRLKIMDILTEATERQGRAYMRDIFDAYSFDENPDWFYKMTVREFLDLESIEERFVPFVTALMKEYLKEQDITSYFHDKKDIEERFEDVIGEIIDPVIDMYGLYGYDEDYEDGFDDVDDSEVGYDLYRDWN